MTTPTAREVLARLVELDEQAPTGFEIGADPQWINDWYQAMHQAREALGQARQTLGQFAPDTTP